MIDLNIVGVQRYTQPESLRKALGHHLLTFVCGGIRRFSHAELDLRDPSPFMYLVLADEVVAAECGVGRENRVVLFDTPHLVPHAREGRVTLLDAGQCVALPRYMQVPLPAVPYWRQVWDRLQTASRQPLPHASLQAKLELLAILGALLEHGETGGGVSAAEALRRKLDADAAGSLTIDALSAECGYSADHMRDCFKHEFGLSPQRYRVQLRVQRARDLIVGSRLSVKEIAATLGFRQVSHFSAVFRKEIGVSPKEAIRLSRYR